ncbi:MAG TPA: hypothetical protein VFZ12_07730, partial [Dehalococcoidia bacterium]|nr:hypothetical protein [Dehalococcoidia bacterium]
IEIFEDWNFDYVKIDFVFAGALPGRRHDPRQAPIEAYREGLAIIRRAAGERFVLGCGAPQLASVGLVDGMRIGPDVAPWWRARGPRDAAGIPTEVPRINSAPAAEAAIRNTLQRAWSHGTLWLNDPDCILARDTQTKLTAAEIESLATVIGLSAGMTLLSDNLPELSEQALRTLSFILRPLPEPAAVRGVLDSDLPGRMEFDAGQRLVVALFNWHDEEQDLTLRVTEAEVVDVWAGTYLGSTSGQLILPSVPPHGCRLLTLTPVDGRPHVLASSFHIGQGIHEIESEEYDPASNVLALRLRPVPLRSGSLWLRWPFETVEIDGPADAHTLDAGILRIDLTVDQPTELTLRPRSRSPRRGGRDSPLER